MPYPLSPTTRCSCGAAVAVLKLAPESVQEFGATMIEVEGVPVLVGRLGAYSFDLDPGYAFELDSIETARLKKVLKLHRCVRRR